jgi:phosphohistidine phosphatase SixA
VEVRFLTIVRHAKAERNSSDGSDFARALNGKGHRQCRQLRIWASDDGELGRFGSATALVSSAARTMETFRSSFDGTPLVADYHESTLIYNGLRNVTAEDVLIDLAAIDPVTTSLMVVGHNPTVLDLLVTLAKNLPLEYSREFPLAGAYVLELRDGEPIGPGPYDFVTRFVPEV